MTAIVVMTLRALRLELNMKRRAGKAVLSHPSILIMAAALIQPAAAESFAFHADHVLGTSLDMKIETTSQSSAELAWFAARSEIDRLEALFSTWRNDSEISRLNRERRGVISRDSARLLERAHTGWRKRKER